MLRMVFDRLISDAVSQRMQEIADSEESKQTIGTSNDDDSNVKWFVSLVPRAIGCKINILFSEKTKAMSTQLPSAI